MPKIGLDGKLYRNTGTYEAPVWVEIKNVKDLTGNYEMGEADVTTRGSGGTKETVPTLLEASFEFAMVWDTSDPNFEAIRTAFFSRTSIEMAVMDGDITTPGSQGPRAAMAVTKFSRKEPLTEAMEVDVTIKPTRSAHPWSWVEVPGGAVAATGSIGLTGLPSDGNTITIGDGVHPAKTFEFDDDASVTPGNISVTIGVSATATMATLITAINTAVPLDVTATASTPPDANCTLENDTAGADGNVPIIKTGAAITVTGMGGGSG